MSSSIITTVFIKQHYTNLLQNKIRIHGYDQPTVTVTRDITAQVSI